MLAVPETHPSVAEPLANGEFVVQQQDQHPFSQTSMDQTIEQTINRDSKTRGGQTGFSNNANAVHRWILSYIQRAEISRSCADMAGKAAGCNEKKDLSKSRCEKDEEDVQNLMHTIESMQNPFTYCLQELINIASGQVAPSEVAEDLLTAYRKGCSASSHFVDERLASKNVDFVAPVKTMKLKTFSSLQRQRSQQKHVQEADQLKADKDLMTRLLIVARNRKVDIQELLTHSLSQFPCSLSTSDGSLQRTNKAALLHHMEAKFPDMLVTSVPKNGALILDGMAVIQQLADKIPATFGDLSKFIFRHIIKLSCFYAASRVDFVCDSIKDNERRRRSSATGCLLRALNDNQKTPNQFRKFLMSGKNKESLGAFLMMQWTKLEPEEFCDKTVYVSLNQGCFKLFPNDDMTSVITETVQELTNDHEEADTLVLLHAKQASGTFSSVTIKTPDTDILLLCLAHQDELSADLYMAVGTGSASRLLSVRPFRQIWNCAFNSSSVSTCFHWL
jgi:CRISPR/Cas system CSM-associated protein Csm2 small subunit